MEANSLKRVLVVSSYSPPAIGGPQNLYNLLKDLPTNQYSILTSFYNIDDHSAINGSWLPCEYVFYDKPKTNKKTRIDDALKGKMGSKVSTKIQQIRFKMKQFTLVRVLAGIPVILFQIILIVIAGRKVIKKTNSEILIGFSDYGPAMLGTFFLHKLTGKPYIIFLFDLYKGNFLPFPGGLLANLFEKFIFKHADKIIVTNEGTKRFYEKLYKPCITDKMTIIHNSIFPESYSDAEENMKQKETGELTILFTGRIYWPQIGALKNLIQSVNEINDLDIYLDIYSPSPKDYLNKVGIQESRKVKIRVATPKEIPEIQKKANILFLPLSWNTKSQAIIDTATPGKLTDYLIAGKPILIHAPTSTYLVKYAKEKNFALTVDEDSIDELKKGIRKLIKDKEYVKMIVKNAKIAFFENHDATKNSRIFYNLLTIKQ